jgi:hypothetical protein
VLNGDVAAMQVLKMLTLQESLGIGHHRLPHADKCGNSAAYTIYYFLAQETVLCFIFLY